MKAIQVKIGDIFNDFTVISAPYKKNNLRVVDCICQCGTIKTKSCCVLNKITRCKKCTSKIYRKYDLEDKIGKLTVKGYKYDPETDQSLVVVQCDCGSPLYTTKASTLSEIKQCKNCFRVKTGIEHPSYKGLKYVSKTYFTLIKHGAKSKNREFNISIEYINDLLVEQGHKCILSGLSIKIGSEAEETTASLDRIDSSKGYIEGNVQWVHKDINRMKTDFDQEYFKTLCKLVSNN